MKPSTHTQILATALVTRTTPSAVLVALVATLLLAVSAHATVTNLAWYRLGENYPGAGSGQIANSTTTDLMGLNDLKRFGSARYTNNVSPAAVTHVGSSLAVSFNGTNQYYSNSIVTTLRNNFGIEAWVILGTAASGQYMIAHNGNAASNGWGIYWDGDSSSARLSALFGGGFSFQANISRRAGLWTHVALVRDNGISTLYVNGAAAGSTNVTPLTPSGAFTIASTTPSPPAALFPGFIDEVRVFTFAAGKFNINDLLVNQSRVTTLDVTNVTYTNVTMNGSASSCGLPTAVWFEWGETTAYGNVTPPIDVGSDVTTTNFSQLLAGLHGGDIYHYRAVSSNSLGIAHGADANFTTIEVVPGGGLALRFNGTNQYMFAAHNDFLNYRELVVTAWINTTQTTGEVGIVNKYAANSLNGWQLFLVNGEVRAWFFGDSANYVWDGGHGLNGGNVADGHWYHLAFAVDEGGGRLYVNGLLKDSIGWTGTPTSATTTQELSLGRYPGGTGEYFSGTIDEVTIRAAAPQTQDQIQVNMNRRLVGRESGLTVYYPLDDGSTFINDMAPSEGNSFGQPVNNPAWVPGLFLRPAVQTKTATGIRVDSAILNGVANPGFTNTIAWFEWGINTTYGNVTPPQPLGSGSSNTNFVQASSGLAKSVAYHYRAVASNSLGASFGEDISFITTGTNLITPRAFHTATLLPTGKVLVTGGADQDNNALSSTELFDPATGTWSPGPSMSTARYQHTATLLPNGKVLVAGGAGVAFAPPTATAEVYDPITGTWSLTGSMSTNRYGQTAILLTSGKVLIAGGFNFGGSLTASELYDSATGTWSLTGPIATGRTSHTATRLSNGDVLIAGGYTSAGVALATAERYNPAAGTWTATGLMTTNRYAHSATLLFNGKVLVVGGGNGSTDFSTAELYNPATGTWAPTGSMLNYRFDHTATLLPNGQVFAAGVGIGVPSIYNPATGTWTDVPGPDPAANATATLLPSGNVLFAGGTYGIPKADAAVYVPPDNGSWTTAGPLNFARYNHTATLLPNSLVLVASYTNSELFHLDTATWSTSGIMNTERSSHAATLLPSGKVLAAGGLDSNFNATHAAELYNPSNGTWTVTGSMLSNHVSATATLLLNGMVLVAGGMNGFLGGPVAGAELYDPRTGTWTATGSMTTNRASHRATLLPNGMVLVSGGTPDTFNSLGSAELYNPATGTWTLTSPMSTNRSGHVAVLLPDNTVLVAGGTSGGFLSSHASAEIFDPATASWTMTTSMTTGRQNASATSLAGGKVLVVGGYNLGYLNTAEVFDPMSRQWIPTASKTVPTMSHMATLLPNGRVLITGGLYGGTGTNRTEVFEVTMLPFRAQISAVSSQLNLGGSLVITGAQFRGFSGGSTGSGAQDSPTDYPLVQIRSLESDRTAFLSAASWSSNSFVSGPVTGMPPGWAMATILDSTMPGTTTNAVFLINFPQPTLPILLTGPMMLPNGSFQFGFSNTPGALFTALASSDVQLPLGNWSVMGSVTEVSPGQFQFTDTQPINGPQRYYRVRSP